MYPGGELRAARAAARADGVDVPDNMHPHDVVRRLERGGYLPRDRARVVALTHRATVQARVRVDARRRSVEQLAMPWDGRWPASEPEQLALL
jgi:hypothetical protein